MNFVYDLPYGAFHHAGEVGIVVVEVMVILQEIALTFLF